MVVKKSSARPRPSQTAKGDFEYKVRFAEAAPPHCMAILSKAAAISAVPSFVLEWWKNGAPDRMKLGTPMSLFQLWICRRPISGLLNIFGFGSCEG
jgi:hypothetical protein